MVTVHLDFPGADSFPPIDLPGVPRQGERVYAEGRYWRVTDVTWNVGFALLSVRPEDEDQ